MDYYGWVYIFETISGVFWDTPQQVYCPIVFFYKIYKTYSKDQLKRLFKLTQNKSIAFSVIQCLKLDYKIIQEYLMAIILFCCVIYCVILGLQNVYLQMNKRNSKKDDYLFILKPQNQSIKPLSPVKKQISRENTSKNFRKQKNMLEFPKIFPIHNPPRHKRYIESCIIESDTSLNMIGTKYMRKMSKEKKNYENNGNFDEVKKDKPLLDKHQSLKYQFLESIVLNNGYSKISLQKKQKEKLKVFIDEGNNSRLINELMRRRPNLKIVSTKKEANIVWTRFCDWQQANIGSNFIEQQKKLFKELSMVERTDTSNSNNSSSNNIFSKTYGKTQTIDASFKNPKQKELVFSQFNLHNHVKNHYEISDKKCLFKNIKKYCKMQKINENEIIPKTYHIEGNMKDLPEDLCSEKKIWIVKPGQDTNQGNGITVQQGRQNVIKAIDYLSSIGKSALVQEYIDPLLYKNRKFDIRCYALVTTYCGNLKAYWYKEGYLRTSCKEFNYEPTNIYAHLTNDAVQKKHKDYGKYEPYNKLSFSDLEIILKGKDISYSNILTRMKELAFMSIKSAEQKLAGDKNMFSFQIFGYDFLIDSKGKLWLIQINTNPCLQFCGSLLSRIIWHMVQNSFAIAIDPFLMHLPEGYNSLRQKIQKIYQDSKFQCII